MVHCTDKWQENKEKIRWNQLGHKDMPDKNGAEPKDIHMVQSNLARAKGKRSHDDTDNAPLLISLRIGIAQLSACK